MLDVVLPNYLLTKNTPFSNFFKSLYCILDNCLNRELQLVDKKDNLFIFYLDNMVG